MHQEKVSFLNRNVFASRNHFVKKTQIKIKYERKDIDCVALFVFFVNHLLNLFMKNKRERKKYTLSVYKVLQRGTCSYPLQGHLSVVTFSYFVRGFCFFFFLTFFCSFVNFNTQLLALNYYQHHTRMYVRSLLLDQSTLFLSWFRVFNKK